MIDSIIPYSEIRSPEMSISNGRADDSSRDNVIGTVMVVFDEIPPDQRRSQQRCKERDQFPVSEVSPCA